VVGLLLGKLLDYWLHTHWLFLIGIIFGAVVGFVQMIRMVTRTKE
jgi:F0F1-type ATP synthase assembly protein I